MYFATEQKNFFLKKHTKVYLNAVYPDYCEGEFLPCEKCGRRLIDIHHLEAKGMGGSKILDIIENLMGLCRKCHNEFGDEERYMSMLTEIHKKFLDYHGVDYDEDFFSKYLDI